MVLAFLNYKFAKLMSFFDLIDKGNKLLTALYYAVYCSIRLLHVL